MHPRALTLLVPAALFLVGCAGGPQGPARTNTPATSAGPSTGPTAPPSVASSSVPLGGEVKVAMSDAMRFAPDPLTVRAGAEVTFVVTNEGVIVHEFFVGTEEEQLDHAAEMAAGGMSHGHDNALTLQAGETGSLTMTFAEAGSLLVGCHEPGHYDAGMRVTLNVVD